MKKKKLIILLLPMLLIVLLSFQTVSFPVDMDDDTVVGKDDYNSLKIDTSPLISDALTTPKDVILHQSFTSMANISLNSSINTFNVTAPSDTTYNVTGYNITVNNLQAHNYTIGNIDRSQIATVNTDPQVSYSGEYYLTSSFSTSGSCYLDELSIQGRSDSDPGAILNIYLMNASFIGGKYWPNSTLSTSPVINSISPVTTTVANYTVANHYYLNSSKTEDNVWFFAIVGSDHFFWSYDDDGPQDDFTSYKDTNDDYYIDSWSDTDQAVDYAFEIKLVTDNPTPDFSDIGMNISVANNPSTAVLDTGKWSGISNTSTNGNDVIFNFSTTWENCSWTVEEKVVNFTASQKTSEVISEFVVDKYYVNLTKEINSFEVGNSNYSIGYKVPDDWNVNALYNNTANLTLSYTIQETSIGGNLKLVEISGITNGNWTLELTSADTVVPLIKDTSATNGDPEAGTNITITTNITDASAISEAYFRISGETGWLPLTNTVGDLFTAEWNCTDIDEGFYNIDINATDSATTPNEIVALANASFSIIDNTNPVITGTTADDGDPEAGTNITITTTLTDWSNISIGEFQIDSVTGWLPLTNTVGDIFTAEWNCTLTPEGIYDVNIRANDSSNVQNQTIVMGATTVNLTDSVNPDIQNTNVEDFNIGTNVTITTVITDFSNIISANATIDTIPGIIKLYNDGTHGDVSNMDNIWTGQWVSNWTVEGTYDVDIYALDGALIPNYVVEDNLASFTLTDITAPTIENATATDGDPQLGGNILITVDLYDLMDITSPLFQISGDPGLYPLYDDGTNGDVVSSDGTYSGLWDCFDKAEGIYNVSIQCFDGADSPNSNNVVNITSFTLVDNTSPTIGTIQVDVNPADPEAGDLVNISVTIDDYNAILSGMINTNVTIVGNDTFPLINTGDEWYFIWDTTGIDENNYTIEIRAKDSNGNNQTKISIDLIRIVDNTAPTIGNTLVDVDPADPEIGDFVNISTTITDFNLISTGLGNTYVTIVSLGDYALTQGVGDEWYYLWNTAGIAENTYTIQITAEDSNGNTITNTTANTVTLYDSTNPQIGAVLVDVNPADPDAGDLVNISTTITDYNAIAPGVTLTYVKIVGVGDFALVNTGGDTWAYVWDTATWNVEDTYDIDIYCEDSNGNTQTSITANSITLTDITAPKIESISATNGEPDAGTITITAEITDSFGIISANATIEGLANVTLNDDGINGDTTASDNIWTGQWSYTSQTEGFYNVSIEASDGSNAQNYNSTINATTFGLADITLPTIQNVVLTDGDPKMGGFITIKVDLNDFSGINKSWAVIEELSVNITLYDDGTHGDEIAGDDTWTGQWDCIDQDEGEYWVNIYVVDNSILHNYAYDVHSGQFALEINTAFSIYYIYLLVGIAGSAIIVPAYRNKVVKPKKQKKLEEVMSSATMFEDAINVQHIIVIYKATGTSIFFKSFGEEKFDPDLISGFLSAVQTFGKSLKATDQLNMMNYGDKVLLFSDGGYVRITLVLGQDPSSYLKRRLGNLVREFENTYEPKLKSWKGRINDFSNAGGAIDKILHTSVILPHQLSKNKQLYKKITSGIGRKLFHYAEQLTRGKRQYVFLAQLIERGVKDDIGEIVEIIVAINELRELELLIPIQLDTEDVEPLNDAQKKEVFEKIQELPNKTMDEKRSLFVDLSRMSWAEVGIILGTLTQKVVITTKFSGSSVETKNYENVEEFKKDLKNFEKQAKEALKKKNYDVAMQIYEVAEALCYQWNLQRKGSSYGDKVINISFDKNQTIIKTAEEKANKAFNQKKYDVALAEFKSAMKAAEEMFKLGDSSMKKNISRFSNKIKRLEKQIGEKEENVLLLPNELRNAVVKFKKDLNKVRKSNDFIKYNYILSKLVIISDKLFLFGETKASKDYTDFKRQVDQLRDKIVNSPSIVKQLLEPIQKLNGQKDELLAEGEQFEVNENYLECIIKYSKAIDIFAKLGDVDNLKSLYNKVLKLMEKVPNFRSSIKTLDSKNRKNDAIALRKLLFI